MLSYFIFDVSDANRTMEFMALSASAVKLYVALKIQSLNSAGVLAWRNKTIAHAARMPPSHAARATKELYEAGFIDVIEGPNPQLTITKTVEQHMAIVAKKAAKPRQDRTTIESGSSLHRFRADEKPNDIKGDLALFNGNSNGNREVESPVSSDEETAAEPKKVSAVERHRLRLRTMLADPEKHDREYGERVAAVRNQDTARQAQQALAEPASEYGEIVKKRCWDTGLRLYRDMGEKRARPIIGRQVKDAGGTEPLLAIYETAIKTSVLDPLTWVTKAIKNRNLAKV